MDGEFSSNVQVPDPSNTMYGSAFWLNVSAWASGQWSSSAENEHEGYMVEH